MKDVAKACGVSIATVSKALNGYSDIGKGKREEIRKVADELGYLPNSSARALKTKRTYNLGILFVDDLTFVNCNMPARQSYYEHCRYRGLEGIVVACIDFYTPEVQELMQGSLPVVTIDHVFDGHTCVVSDNVQGMRELVRYIYGRGHRKIAYIHGLDSSTTKGRLNGYHKMLSDYGVKVPDAYIKKAAYRDTEETKRLTGQLLDLSDPPTCILCPDDFSALGCMNAIRERGLRIPEDISVAGYDGITISQLMEPKLTTIRQDTGKIGQIAAQELIHMIEQPKTTLAKTITVPGELLEGSSVKRL